MYSRTQEDKQTEIKAKIKKLQAANPGLTFQKAWDMLQKSAPHLFSSETERSPVVSEAPVALSEAIRLFKRMSPGQLVQAHLNGMLEDGTPWNENVTLRVMSARPIIARPFDHNVKPEPRSPLDKRVRELMSLNLGTSLKEVMEYLRHTEPELFNEEDDRPADLAKRAKAQSRQQALSEAVQKTRQAHPQWDFSAAYNQTVEDHPELLDNMTVAIGDLEE
jgi:hypothetical protein